MKNQITTSPEKINTTIGTIKKVIKAKAQTAIKPLKPIKTPEPVTKYKEPPSKWNSEHTSKSWKP